MFDFCHNKRYNFYCIFLGGVIIMIIKKLAISVLSLLFFIPFLSNTVFANQINVRVYNCGFGKIKLVLRDDNGLLFYNDFERYSPYFEEIMQLNGTTIQDEESVSAILSEANQLSQATHNFNIATMCPEECSQEELDSIGSISGLLKKKAGLLENLISRLSQNFK